MDGDSTTTVSPLAISIPNPSVITRPFWEGCAQGEFRLQSCKECGEIAFPPRGVCPRCCGSDLQWQPAAGNGTIVTYTKLHRGPGKSWQALCPYVVVVVKLAEGPTVTTRLIDWQDSDLQAGRAVQVAFLETGTELGIPVFRPAPASDK